MVRKAAKFRDLDDDTLKCRSWNHSWEHVVTYVDTYKQRKASRAVATLELQLQCTRCGTYRTDVYNRAKGELLSRRYEYNDEYLIGDLSSWGGRKTFNGNVRVELVARLSVDAKPRLKEVG